MNPKDLELLTTDTCPYCDDSADICRASVTSLRLGAMLRLNHCNSKNYDGCSLFLAKCLRKGSMSEAFLIE